MTDTTTSSDPVVETSLQERIQTLTDVHNRLRTLRHLPTLLLRAPSASPLADFPPSFDATIDREFGVTFDSTPAHDFRALNEFVGMLCGDKVQDALRVAQRSEEADQSELCLSLERESGKRKYVLHLERHGHEKASTCSRPRSPVSSPQPYVPSPPRSWSMFASGEDEPAPLRAESLIEFVREFNRCQAEECTGRGEVARCRLVIWTRTEAKRDALKEGSTELASPVVLRFVIRDVLTAYISLIFASTERPVVVESVAAFGPRERKLPHEQSDYLAFRGLSQHVGRMLVSHPRVPVQVLMNVLVSYRGLFVERCGVCERVLSGEGHVPAVGRVFDGQLWVARHSSCVEK